MHERVNAHLKTDQQKNQGIHDKGDVGPKGYKRGLGLHATISCSEIPDNEASHRCCDDARQVQLIGEKIAAIGDDSSEGDLDFRVIDPSRQPACDIANQGTQNSTSDDCQEELFHPFHDTEVSRDDADEDDLEQSCGGTVIQQTLALDDQ